MLRQYFAQRCRGGDNPLRVGTIAVGAIYYIQPDYWWRDRLRGHAANREPWIVEAFFNGVMAAARRDPVTHEWLSIYLTGRSDIALIRSLRTGRTQRIGVRVLQLHDDEGLSRGIQSYPSMPSAALVDGYFRRRYGASPRPREIAA